MHGLPRLSEGIWSELVYTSPRAFAHEDQPLGAIATTSQLLPGRYLQVMAFNLDGPDDRAG